MSYDDKTDKMNWKNEYSWMASSLILGIFISTLFLYFKRFPNCHHALVIFLSCIGIYILSILIRIQNHRGKILTGKTGTNEKILKFIFPVFGIGLGIALLFL